MTQDTEAMKVVLGGLLHDIGKFGQRAGAPRSDEMTSTYCPAYPKSKRPTHLHVLYTDYFIEHDLPLPRELEGKRAVLAKIASTHHMPDDTLETLSITIADWLSSGLERIPDEEEKQDFRKAPLKPIFREIFLDAARNANGPLTEEQLAVLSGL